MMLIRGLVYLQIENAANTTSTAYPSATAVDDGGWHHVAATRTPDGTVKLYVDGLLDAAHAGTPDTAGSSQTVGMGFSYQDSGSGPSIKPPLLFWNGSLDDLTLWSVTLGDSAIADLAANGVPASPTGLVAHWELDEGAGQPAADSAAAGSHPGTLGATAGVEASDPAWACGARVSDSIVTGGQGCDSQTCTKITHVFDSATGAGAGLLELSGSTLDFRVGIESATFMPAVCPNPIFEFSDVLITDAAYTDTGYLARVGCGHSCVSQVAGLAHAANLKKLCLFHHDLGQNDEDIDAKLAAVKKRLRELGSSTICKAPAEGDLIRF